MSDTKISNLTELTAPVAEDELVIVDKSDTTMAASGTTKKITKANLVPQITPASSSAPASLDLHEDTDNGTNKITVAAPSAVASDKTLTLPDITDTVATATGWTPYITVIPTHDTATQADDPTYVITFAGVDLTDRISVGMRIKITQSTAKYFIVTAIAFSTNTTVTLYGGTDYDLVDTDTTAISAFSFSPMKAPFGFPVSPLKWTVSSSSSTDRSTASATYATLTDNIVVPIGIWKICIKGIFYFDNNTTTQYYGFITLSSSTTAETYPSLTSAFLIARSVLKKGAPTYIEDTISFDSKTTLTLIGKIQTGATGVGTLGNTGAPTIIRAICAYL